MADTFERRLQQCEAALSSLLSSWRPDDVSGAAAALASQDVAAASCRAALELAFRTVLQQLFRASPVGVLTSFPSRLSLLLSLSIACTPSLLDPLQPFLLLEDAFEYTPLSSLPALLSLLSSHSAALSAPALFSSSPKCKLTLLRLCNGVVRRLSKTEQAEQSGRVMQLVAAMLPVEDRGGVNLTGKFNVDNRTVVEEEGRAGALQDEQEANSSSSSSSSSSMSIDGEAKDEEQRHVKLGAGLVDVAFYRTLWSLQTVFADPRQQLKQPESYAAFLSALKTVLAAFDRAPPAASSSFSSLSSASSSSYFPKYLSGSRLLNLQLQDATFRRHLLTQSSLLFHYLINPTGDAAVTLTSTSAFVPIALPASSTSSSAPPAPLLTAAQLEEIRPLISAVLRQLAAGGDGYDSHLLRLLQEEQAWMRWKMNKAPTFSRPPAVMQSPLTVDGAVSADRRRKGKGAKAAGSGGLLLMGSEALAELWSASPDNEESIRDDARVFAPELQPKLDELLEEDDDWQRRKKRAAERKLKQEKQERKAADTAADASASSASPSPDSEQAQEEEDEEELDERQLLRDNPQRQWTLLRLLRRCDHALFLRSEGTLDGLVEELKRRRKAREEQQAKERERGEKEEKEADKETEKEAEAEAVMPEARQDDAKDAAVVKQERKAEEEMETAEADGEGEPEPLELELSRPQEETKAEAEETEKAAEVEAEADDEDDGDSRRKRRAGAAEGGAAVDDDDDGDGGSRKRKGDDGVEEEEERERRKKRKGGEPDAAAEAEAETEGRDRQQVEEGALMPKLIADGEESKMAESEEAPAATASKDGLEQNGHEEAASALPPAVAAVEAPPIPTDDAMVG